MTNQYNDTGRISDINVSGITEKEQKILSFAICALISFLPITHFVNVILNFFVAQGFIYDTLLFYIVLLVILVRAIYIVFKYFVYDVFFFTLLLLGLYIISYFLFADNRIYMFTTLGDVLENPFYGLFVFGFLGYAFVRNIKDYSILFKYLKVFSIIVVIVSTISFLIQTSMGLQPEYMVFSYGMLAQTVFLFVLFFNEKKIFVGIISVIGILVIFVAGARGPIVTIIAVLVLYSILKMEKSSKKIIGIVTMSTILIVIYIYFDKILVNISNINQAFGIYSRSIERIYNNDFFYSIGRSQIWGDYINNITFFGLGMFGDRVLLDRYSHNIFIEILVQFGYIIGPVILGLIIYVLASGFISKNVYIRNLTIVFVSSGFLKLLMSGSYLSFEPSFYILLGMGVNAIKEKRSKIKIL